MQQADLLPAQVHSVIRVGFMGYFFAGGRTNACLLAQLLLGCMALSALRLTNIEDPTDAAMLAEAAKLLQLPSAQVPVL
jgi:hypothetical protein